MPSSPRRALDVSSRSKFRATLTVVVSVYHWCCPLDIVFSRVARYHLRMWHNIHVLMPNDADLVWFVRIPYFDTPVQAQFDLAGDFFQWQDSNGTPHYTPTDQVFKWRLV